MNPENNSFNQTNQIGQMSPISSVPSQNMETPKSKLMPVVIILAVLAVVGFGFGGFELWQNMKKDDEIKNLQAENTKNENTEQEETSRNINVTSSFSVPNASGAPDMEDGMIKNYFATYDGVLFSYSIYSYLHPYGHVPTEVFSENYDLNSGEKLDNKAILDKLNISIEDLYRKLLSNIADTVKCDSFLLNPDGIVSTESISITDFRDNIDSYIEVLQNNYSQFNIFIKDSKLTVSYSQSDILKELQMSSHMDAGLVAGIADFSL